MENFTNLVHDSIDTKALTDWTKEPVINDLKHDLQIAQSATTFISSKVSEWLAALQINNKPKDPNAKRSQISPPLIRKQAEWRYPALTEPFLSNDDMFEVSGTTWEDTERAEQNALLLNYQFRTKMNRTKFIDKYVRKLVNEGTAVLRVGWLNQKMKVDKDVPVFEYTPLMDQASIDQLQEYINLSTENVTEFLQLDEEIQESVRVTIRSNSPTYATIVGYETVKTTKTIRNHPVIDVCNLSNLYIDPTCNGDMSKANFVIYAFDTSLSDLRKAGSRYTNLEQINVSQSTAVQASEYSSNTVSSGLNFNDDARKKIIAYEYWGYWDIDGSGITQPIVATWVDNVLIRMELNPYPDGQLPFVVVQYLPDVEGVYGEPDAVLLEDDQKILGAVTRGVIDLMAKSAHGQTGMPKGALDATNLRKFKEGNDYEYNPTANPSLFYQHKYPDIPQAAMYMINHCNNDAESLTGTKAFSSSGLTGSALGGSTATSAAVRGVLDAATKREMSILRRLADGLIEVGRKIVAMNSLFLDESEVIRVTNSQYLTVRRDDLAGEFDLSIAISTPEADEAKAQELSFMLQTMGNSIDSSMVNMILSKIAKLRKMPDLAHAIESFKPEPDPMAIAAQEAEIAYKKAQTELLLAQAEEARAKAVLNGTKVIETESKTRKAEADAINKEIDAERKSNGVDHLEKIAEKAIDRDTNLEMKKFDHNSQALMKAADQSFPQKAMVSDQ